MFGQTNCFVLPSGEYGAFEVNGGEIYVCSERSANNMAYQDLTPEPQKVNRIATLSG
jgi:leucyl-tRNA synthetase